MLDYATQVSELRKIARLSPRRAVVRAAPELRPSQSSATCLVCGKSPARACGACGSVSYCGIEHQRADAEFHDSVCDALREINEDARTPIDDALDELLARADRHRTLAGLSGWDAFLGTDLTRVRPRRLSDLATRPLTLASMITALAIAPRGDTLTVHVMAASRRELEVPADAWSLVGRLVPECAPLDLTLVGPELPDTANAAVRTRKGLYSRDLWRELARPDLVIGYDCGLMMYPTWKSTILELRGSGVPFVITSYRDWEAFAEARLLTAVSASCLLAPAANPWATLMGKRSSTIANDVSYDNAYVSAWR